MTTTMHAQESHKNKLSTSTMYNNNDNSNNYSSNGENNAFLFQCPSEHVKELNAVKSAFAISHHYFDGWIYLFLANKKYDIAETIAKLKRRADMEQHVFRHYTITPSLRASMRAGIVQYIGDDKAGRPVLYFNTSRDQPKASERAERQANFDIFLSWSLRIQRSNPTSGVTWLINQHHASLLRNTDLVFQKDMALRTSKFYPGTVARMYLCNMNSALTFVMKPLLRQLPKAISETIFMYSNHDLKNGKLLEVMDDHVLPIAMGGSNDCDHPSNYEWFANQVEEYFSRCVHALNNHISIKEMEMMEEFHVDVHGRPLIETVKSTYEKNVCDKNSYENVIEKSEKATKVDENMATGHNNTDTTETAEEFRLSENKEKEEEVKEQKERLEEEEQLIRSSLSAKETQTNNTITSNMTSTSTLVQHQTYTTNRNSNKNNKSNSASNNELSLLVDGNDDNDDGDDVNSDDNNLKTPIEACSDDDNIGCGECIKDNNRKDKHQINMNKHSYELINNERDNNIYNSKEDVKSKINKNNYSTNKEVGSVLEIIDGHKGLVHTKNANNVKVHKNENGMETNNESPHVYLHDDNNIPFSHVSHVLEQTPLSVAFDDDQVVITSNRYKSEVRWNDRHVADELPLDISYNNSNNTNNIEASKKNTKNNVIEEDVTNTEGIEREFSLHDSFASGLISTPINDLLSFNTQLHERHESYLINNTSESKSSENYANKEQNHNEEMEAEEMASKDVSCTNDAGNKILKTEIGVNENNNNENEQSIQLAKQLEFANNTNTNSNMRQKSTLAECATSKEYREFVSYYISYKIIEIAKHIKCNKSDEINALKENWNAFMDVCYTLQHPVEHIVHVLHGQTTKKSVCNSTSNCCNNCSRKNNISENECCTNSIESVVEFIKAHVSDITRLIQHLLLLSVPSSHVLYILSNGCISATSSPFITEEDYSCKDNQEHNTTSKDTITTKETMKKELFELKEQHQLNSKEESMLESTNKENNNELVSFLEPLQVDCTSADNLLLSLQASTVVFVEQCEEMIELHKTHQRVLRRTLLTWSNKLSRDEYVFRLAQRAKTLWHELVPWLRQYIECKVHMAIASFMAHYGLLIAHGKIDTTSNWYKTLFRSILHFREVHRHSWLFHLLPPFTFTNTQKQTQNINITNDSSKLLSESNLENNKEEVLEEEKELCFHVHAPSVTELLNKSHLPESTEGLCTLIVMVETSLKATLQQLQKITSMAAEWQVDDDPASPTFPARSEANSKTITTNYTNTSKSKIKNSSFFGKTMENLTSCNSYNNSNHNDSFANSTQLSQRNNTHNSNITNSTNSSNTTTIPPILYTNHYIIDRYLEYSHARISIPFESQSMGLSPVEMIISEQIKACAFLTAAETPLKEFLFTNASLYLLSSCSISSHELTQQIQMQTPSKNKQGKKLNEKQEREEWKTCEQLHKEGQISDASNDCETNKEAVNSPFTTTSLVASDEANVMIIRSSWNNTKSTNQAIQANHNLDNVEVKSESNESDKNDIDSLNTDIDKSRSPHIKEDAHLDLMQKIRCNKEGHSTGNTFVLAELKCSINKYDKNSNAESTPEANKMQTTEKHYLAEQLSKIHHALKEERCQRRISTALAMAAYHVQCNGTIYGYGGTDDTDEFIKTFQSRNKTNIEEKISTEQIVCRHSKQDNAHRKHKEQKATTSWNNNAESISTNVVSVDNNDANSWYAWPSYGFRLALQLMEMLAYLTWHDESKQLAKIENEEQQQELENEEFSIRDGNVVGRNDTNKFEEKKINNASEKKHWEEIENQEQELLPSTTLIESPTDTHNVVEQSVYLCSINNTNNSNTTNVHNNKNQSNSINRSTNTETSKTKLLQDVQVLIDNARHANEYALPVAEAKRQYIFMTFTN